MSSLTPLIELSAGEEAQNNFVRCELLGLGCDFLLVFSGGADHIGAISCSDKKRSEELFSYELIHHKEALVVEKAMTAVKALLPGELLVVGGIHYDDIDQAKIMEIVKVCEMLLAELVNEIKSLKFEREK